MSHGATSPWYRWALSWRQQLGVRIVAALVGVSFVLTAVGTFYDYGVDERASRERLLSHGRSLARQAALACPDPILVSSDWPKLQTYVTDLVVAEKFIAFAAVERSSDGKIVASHPPGVSSAVDASTQVIEQPILLERGGEQLGTFTLGLSLRPMQEALRERTTRLLLRAGLGFLLVGALLWLALRHVVVEPLRRLDAEAQRLGRGQLGAPLSDFGTTELGRLGRTLEQMRANLSHSYTSLADQNRRLTELNQLKSQFLANISHEIRTPLTSILGGVEFLTDPAATPEERAHSQSALQRNGEHLLELVDRLLDLAKLEGGSLLVEKRPCQPAQVVQAACERWRTAAVQKGLELLVDTAPLRDVVVGTDAARLRQMVSSIVGNAVKFTEAGRVEVTVGLDGEPGKRLLHVVVTDTGVGIPAAFLGRLFDTFSQVDGSVTRQHGGTGLGLAMAKKVAKQLGGDVVLQSEPGRGTRVEITVAVDDVQAQKAGEAVPAPRLAGRVLVVDDAPDNQRLLKAMLTRFGITVSLADNGRRAVECMLASREGEPFDLVLMDLQMPELDGIGAIRELRAKGFQLPIVAVTAHALADDRERCLAAGANGYETKPITRQRLHEVVSAHLRPAASPA